MRLSKNHSSEERVRMKEDYAKFVNIDSDQRNNREIWEAEFQNKWGMDLDEFVAKMNGGNNDVDERDMSNNEDLKKLKAAWKWYRVKHSTEGKINDVLFVNFSTMTIFRRWGKKYLIKKWVKEFQIKTYKELL